MTRRPSLRLFLVLLAALFLVGRAGASFSALGDGLAFDHQDHVSVHWSSRAAVEKKLALRNGEQPRDCRGCHDYRAGVPAKELAHPADRCGRCHDPDGFQAQTLGLTVDRSRARVDPAREKERLFRHADHLVRRSSGEPIDCAECHYQDTGTRTKPAWAIRLPSENREGRAYCVTCHDQSSSEVRESFNRGLTREAEREAGTQAEAVFTHAAHLSPQALAGGEPQACLTCHTALGASSPGALSEVQFETTACSSCHVGTTFEASRVAPSGDPLLRSSPTRGVFSHAQHTGAPRGSANVPATAAERLGREGCLACHAFESTPSRADGVRSFALKPFLAGADGKGSFQGCVQCHTDVVVPDHGNVDACARCHAIEPGSLSTRGAMADNRPRVLLARVDAASFTFERQSHAFISRGREKDAPESCKQCHRARLPAQPSRLIDKPFRHATHVALAGGKDAASTEASCRKCHAEVAGSKDLAALGATYDASACVECHGDTPPTTKSATNPSQPPRTSGLRFDHAAHVGKRNGDSGVLGCASCHVAETAAGGELEIVLAKKVAECSLCHAHPPKAEATRNRFSKSTVESCARCHVAGVPDKGREVQVERARVVRASGFQRHEGDQPCSSCHQRIEQPFPAVPAVPAGATPPSSSIAFQLRDGKPKNAHDARLARNKAANRGSDPAAPAIYFYDEVACIECHWSSSESCTEAEVLNAARRTKNESVKKLLSDPKWRDTYRAAFGRDLGGESTSNPHGYPGIGPALPR